MLISPLNKFNEKIKEIKNFDEYKEQVDIYKKLKNSIFFIEIYNTSKNIFKIEQEKEIFDYTIEQFNKLKKLAENSNLNILDKVLINILISATKNNRNKLINELYFIKKYFNINKNNDKFDVEKIAFELENLIPDKVEEIEISTPKEDKKIKLEENKYVKIFVDKFNECYNYYKYNKRNKEEDNYFEKFTNYFKEIIGDEKINELNSNDFTNNITKKMFILFYSRIIDFTYSSRNKLKNELQLIKDLFEIINIYKIINNDNLYSISENLKTLFPILLDRLSDRGNDIFKGLSEGLFPSIVEKDELKKNSFSSCFINIIKEEIKIGRIKDEPKVIFSFIFRNEYLIENCMTIINYYFKDKFFSTLINKKINNNSIIYFKDSSLSLIDTNCKNNQIFREQLLYYFETNINRILEDKYPKNDFIQNDIIKIFLRKIRAYFKEKPKDKTLNENINLLFFIAFLKVFFTKYINEIEKQINLRDDFYDNFLIEENFSLSNSLSYFILKLYLDINGNYSDFLRLNKIPLPKKILESINNNIDNKTFGFDYLIIPFNKERAVKFNQIYRQIINCINDSKNFQNDIRIIEDINNNDIDILYCIISNLFLSKLSTEKYPIKDEYTLLNKWLNEKLEKNSFDKLNEYSKKILSILINMRDEKNTKIKIEFNKDLIVLLFSLRFVLNSLSNKKNYFLYDLLIDTNNIIQKNKNILDYFFSSNENGIGFELIKFIIFSHLIFANLLNNISLEKISELTYIKLEENNITKALSLQFRKTENILKTFGIKNKYRIIYMNIIFEEMKNKLGDLKEEIKYFNKKLLRIDSQQFKNYFEILDKIDMRQNMDMNDFKKIIFEEDYINLIQKVIKEQSFIYFTTPNFCDINDFMFQYKYSNFNSTIIEYVLNHKMDDIINKINCLPIINNIINKLYNEYNLKITKTKSMEQNINIDGELINKFNEIIPQIKKYFNIELTKIDKDTKLNEMINLKENKIYKLYESLNSTIEDFNNLLNNYKPDKEIIIEKKHIQDISNNYFTKNKDSNNIAFDTLLELIETYSTRNRYDNADLNIYNGDRILYDYKMIEKILINEFIFGKKLLVNSQRIFIFSNEVFSKERINLFNQIKLKIKKENNEEIILSKELLKLEEEINDEIYDKDNEEIKELYYNIQNILLFIYYYVMNNDYKYNEKISLKEICDNIEEEIGYNKINKKLINSEIYIDEILYLYENIEEKMFDILNEIFLKDEKLKQENLKNKKKEEIDEYFKSNKYLLLTKDIILKAIKKYIMRYCLGDYEKEEEILKNINSKKIFNKEDIWDNKIFNDTKFKEECNKLIEFNNNDNDNLEQYFLDLIFNGEEEEEEKEKDDKDDDNKSDKSESSNKSKKRKNSDSNEEEEKNDNSDSERDDNKSEDE